LTPDEACRLGLSIAAGYETLSRAEYYSRTGLSEPVMQQIANWLTAVPDNWVEGVTLRLHPGNEEVENPPRPRLPY
jgi:hypothetical protein